MSKAHVSRTEIIDRPFDQVNAIIQSPEAVCRLSPLCIAVERIVPSDPYHVKMTDKLPIILSWYRIVTFDVKWVKIDGGITSYVETEGVKQLTTFTYKAVGDKTEVTIADDLEAPWWILWFVKQQSYNVKTEIFASLPTAPIPPEN